MAIDRLKKEDKQILERGGNYAVGQPGYDWPPFLSGQAGVHDYVECHIYDESGESLIESFITTDYEIKNNQVVTKPGNDLRSKGYIRGKYQVRYNFFRKEFGTNETVLVYADGGEVYTGPKRMYPGRADRPWYIDDDNLIYAGIKGEDESSKRKELLVKDLSAWVHKISDDRKEIRIVPNDIQSDKYKREFNSLSKLIQRWHSPGPSTEDARITFSDGFGGNKIKIDGVKRWKRHNKQSVGGEFVLPRGFITHIERRVYEVERYLDSANSTPMPGASAANVTGVRPFPRTLLNQMPLPNQPLVPYERQQPEYVEKELPRYSPSKTEPTGYDFIARMIGAANDDGFGDIVVERETQIQPTQTVEEIQQVIEEDLSQVFENQSEEDYGGS
tara:strand:+ start:4791 stop:5954 length:1164 start_codon:yes stop_codon:yes gene_type:complete